MLDEAGFEDSGKEFYIGDEKDLRLAEENQADGVRWILENDINIKEAVNISSDITIKGEGTLRMVSGEKRRRYAYFY